MSSGRRAAKNSTANFGQRALSRFSGSGNSRRASVSKESVLENLKSVFAPGEKLNLARKHRPDYFLLVLTAILALVGLVTLFSIAPAVSGVGDTSAFMWRQGMFLIVSIVAFFVMSRFPLDLWRRFGTAIFVVALILCFVLPIMGWLNIPPAFCTLGACRWFSLGPVGTFQPAEFLKFGIVLLVSGFLAARSMTDEINSWQKTLVPIGIVILAALFVVIVMQKDLGTGIAMIAIFLIQLVVAGVRWRNLLGIVVVIAILGVLSIAIAPHRLARVATFFGQGSDTADYHINQAMIALGSGGAFGRGLGQSVQAFGWLPEAIHDSIFAIIGEMFGFVGVMALLLAFAALLKRIIDKTDYLENVYLRLIVAGIFGWLSAHVLLNIGAMTGLIPLTGITLPLVSFGGTSMLFTMSALGVVFAISRYTVHKKIDLEEGVAHADFMRGRRIGRSRVAGRGGR